METTINEISSAIETLAESMEFDELDDNDFGDVLQGDQKLEEVFEEPNPDVMDVDEAVENHSDAEEENHSKLF